MTVPCPRCGAPATDAYVDPDSGGGANGVRFCRPCGDSLKYLVRYDPKEYGPETDTERGRCGILLERLYRIRPAGNGFASEEGSDREGDDDPAASA